MPIDPPVPAAVAVAVLLLLPQLMDPPYEIGGLPALLLVPVEGAGNVGGVYGDDVVLGSAGEPVPAGMEADGREELPDEAEDGGSGSDEGDGVVPPGLLPPENLPAMHLVNSCWSFHVEPSWVGVRERT